MKLTFDLDRMDFYVQEGDRYIDLRTFYIEQRKKSGIKVSTLELRAGLSRPSLRTIEKARPNGKRNNSMRSMLAGLEALGFEIELMQVERVRVR